MGSNNSSSGSSSGLSPLKYNAFRAVWIAAIASNIGSLMEAVGESWLMTSLVTSSLIVALTWASDSLSITALALPAGALADIVDRRKLLIISQSWMLAVALTLAIVTIAGFISPVILLVLIFLLGLGEAISTPAFSPFLLGTVPRTEIRSAITLNGVALNIGRGIGPAIGGVLIAAIGPAAVFLLNALSFAGIVIVLLRIRDNNKPSEELSQLPAERMFGAMRAGLRYVKNSPSIHSVFVRVAVFAISSSALPALLPSLSRYTLRLDSTGYGILFGLFGLGAIIGGMIIVPRAIKKMSPDHLIILATVIFSISLFILGTIHNLVVLYAAMVLAGIAQLMAFSSLTYVLYRTLPNWVMSRVSSVYQLVFQGTIVAGTVLWGTIADRLGIRIALLITGMALVAGLITKLKFPLRAGEGEVDVSPSMHWPEPALVIEPELEHGPVLVQIQYKIDPVHEHEFAMAVKDLGSIRKRGGAFFWGIFRHDTYQDIFIESFLIDSWAEHLRQHERITIADRTVEDRVLSFHIGNEPPVVSHFIAEPVESLQ
jgi:MFS family permease